MCLETARWRWLKEVLRGGEDSHRAVVPDEKKNYMVHQHYNLSKQELSIIATCLKTISFPRASFSGYTCITAFQREL